MNTTAPTFEFHLTFTDVTEAEALMRHLETAQQQRSVELDIRDGVVSVTLTPPPAPELPKWNWALPEDDAAGTFRDGVSLSMFRSCRLCGCTDSAACPGGCSWVEADLCSACCDRLATAARVEVADGVDAVAFAGDPLEHQVDQQVWPPTGTVESDDRTPLALFHALVEEAVAAQLLEAPAPGFVTASWSTAFFEFEGMSARRIAFAAVELLAGASVPGIDELIGRYVPALEAALAAPAPSPTTSEEDLAAIAALEGVTVEEARRVVDGEPELHVMIEADDSAARAAFGGGTAATDTPPDDAEPDECEALVDDDQEATDAGGSGDAGPREDPEGSSSGPGTPPDPPATFTPSPGPLTDQVVELLNAYPEVTFRPGDVDDALRLGNPVSAATKLGAMAKAGRIQKIDRGLYRALDQAAETGDDSGARERIVRWLTDNEKGSTTRIAAGTGLDHTVVVDELRRMSDAGVARVAHGGWVLRTDHDTAELIEQRRFASAQGM